MVDQGVWALMAYPLETYSHYVREAYEKILSALPVAPTDDVRDEILEALDAMGDEIASDYY